MDTFTGKYDNSYYLNTMISVPIICNIDTSLTLEYEDYYSDILTQSNNLSIDINIPNYMRDQNIGNSLLLPYFIKYQNIEEGIDLISEFSLIDNSITVENSLPIIFNETLSTFLEIMNDTKIILLVKILSIKFLTNNKYKIFVEFVSPSIDYTSNLYLSKIVVCEVLSFTIVSGSYLFSSPYIMNYAFSNNLKDIQITSIKNCYNAMTKEIICNCAGNSISKSKTIANIYSENNYCLNNNAISLIDNEVQKYIVLDKTLPEIIRNNSFFITNEITTLSGKNDWTTSILIKITNERILLELNRLYLIDNNLYTKIGVKVNSYTCTIVRYGIFDIRISVVSGNPYFKKYDNLIQFYTIENENYANQVFMTHFDNYIRTPICFSDFYTLENLNTIDAITHDKNIDFKYITNNKNNNLKQVVNTSSSISITEYEKIINETDFYFSLDNDNFYNLVSYNNISKLTKIFLNCQTSSTSLTEDMDVNKKQFTINYEKELRYNINDFTLEEI